MNEKEKIVRIGDVIFWNLELIDLIKEEKPDPIPLIVDNIEYNSNGSKTIWMRKTKISKVEEKRNE